MDTPDISKKSLTPHGSGFSFLDKIISLDAKEKILIGEKWLDPGLPFFKDHFPGEPLMPGVLLIEAGAQAAGVLLAAYRGGEERQRYMLAQVADFRLRQPVLPDQVLKIKVTMEKDFGTLVSFLAILSVDDVVVAKGKVTLSGQETC